MELMSWGNGKEAGLTWGRVSDNESVMDAEVPGDCPGGDQIASGVMGHCTDLPFSVGLLES
jgi:hypothetical protein